MNATEREAWLARRNAGIGGSEIAVLVGEAPDTWGGPIDIWLRKTGRSTGEKIGGPWIEWGQRLEPVIADKYAEVHGVRVVELPAADAPVPHPKFPHVLVSPDRIVVDAKGLPEWILEIKNQSPFALGWGEPGTDQVPGHYLCQGHYQAGVFAARWGIGGRCDYPVLVGKDDYREYTTTLDPDFAGELYEVAEQFWRDYVVNDTPPPVDGSAAWKDVFAKRHPRETKGKVLTGSPELDHIMGLYKDANARKAEAEREIKALQNKARELLEDAEGARGAWGSVSYKWRDGYTVKAYDVDGQRVLVPRFAKADKE